MVDKKTILIVDDEIVIRDVFKRALKKYDIITAESGEEALELLSQKRPDLVLLDMKMQGINGLETLKRIKEFDKSIIVIIITAFADEKIAEKTSQLGAQAFLTKPFSVPHVISLVDQILSNPKNID